MSMQLVEAKAIVFSLCPTDAVVEESYDCTWCLALSLNPLLPLGHI